MKCVRCKSGESEKSFENHSSDNCHDEMYQEYVAREEGYVYVFVSNENPTLVEVYFDDVTVTITPGNVIQANEYYPYGLQTTNSWTRSSSLDNNFLYNGGTELNKTTQVYDLYYRNYDPALGRFGQVDPMASMLSGLSPYNYANGEPIRLNDPLGNCPTCGCMVCDAPDLYLSPKKKYEGGSLNAFEEFVQGNFSRAYGEANGMGLNGAGNYGMWRGNMFNQGVGNGVAATADAYRRSYSESTGDRQTIYQSGMQQYILNPWAGQEGAPGKYYAAWVEMDFNLMAVILLHGFNVVTATVERYATQSGSQLGFSPSGNDPNSLDPSTVGRNPFGLSYPGPWNPMTFPDANGNRRPDYTTVPRSLAEYPAIGHDRRYDRLKISGFWGLVSDTRAIGADWQFVKEEFLIAATPFDASTRLQAGFFATLLGGAAMIKTAFGLSNPQSLAGIIMWYHASNFGVTNAPGK